MKCLFCYKDLKEGQTDYHPACARKFFGVKNAPKLPYVRAQLGDLARKVVRAQTTLTGVQAKLSLDIDKGGRNLPDRFTIVGLWGRFILKPQTDTYRALPELEDLTMHMAEAAKIMTVPHCLIRFSDGELCYITRRIDRLAGGGKVPMEDMCQLTGRLTEYKYKGSYEQIAKAIRRYSSAPQLDVVNFWEVVVFSWITGNADMHLKNFSLYNPDGGGYTLTPAYDMLATTLVMPEEHGAPLRQGAALVVRPYRPLVPAGRHEARLQEPDTAARHHAEMTPQGRFSLVKAANLRFWRVFDSLLSLNNIKTPGCNLFFRFFSEKLIIFATEKETR